jgi:hypothetical protein
MERERRAGAAAAETEPGPDADAISLSQVEAVLRRAVQLDAQQRSPEASGLSAEEVTRIALDAGLTPAAVDAALRELKLGALTQDQKLALLDKHMGPRTIRAGKVLELPPEAAAAALRRLFEDELLEPLERDGRRTTWAPQPGLRANVLRTVRHGWAGRGDWRRLEIISDVRAADASGQRSIVSLEVRLEGRASLAAGPAALAAVTVLGTLSLAGMGFAHLAQHVPDAAQLLLASGANLATFGGLSALAFSGAGRAWRKRVRRVRASLDKLLDGL